MPAHAASLLETAEALLQAVKPGPHLFVGGQGFAADAQLAGRVPGHYLPLNAPEATQEIRKRMTA